ncbi:hypothetical protein ERO13_A10G108300v2 [Gossypium hirsutum]|uniref:Uncharacterized protein n=3 Tax=Gossypium TaxID=3633 RepID=A0A2P5WRL2_GOSBA|nr:uncharacterized protein LOC107897741 isoform X1 [Gossypium hirsutum]KAB2061908.1 hypothetical protein ES319_A10G118000v1 [Gossypium barbadense]KAG4179492.1 hypothetical protein ERO13_A10G108300v2 [Gossypium hirsutum]PPR93681.1 hypothetical protein GOBAR_AA26987 [Gossypium barbadense]TYI06012.1 hypothetical protein ES332_A10G128500v1 [Gossypium tomentosum]
MGCFLGCFGISTKRRRRKPANRILPGPADSKLVSYEPLDSSINVDIPEDSIASKPPLSNKPKERSSVKIRKKVSFNLNVQTYEPIPDEETTTYQFLQSVEEEEREKVNGGEAAKRSLPSLSEGISSSLQTSSYPCIYRYQNCRDGYEEEDEMVNEESDIEDDEFFSDEDDYGDDDDKHVDDQFDSLNMDSTKGASLVRLDDDRSKNQMPLDGSADGNLKSRSQYLCSVLNPVENTTQWKEIKARAAAKPKQMRKENVAAEGESQVPFSSDLRSNCSTNYNQSKPLLQDIAVDASLSNWLVSPSKSQFTGSTNSCSIAFDTLQSKTNISDGLFSRRSREDRVILDITNL